MATGASLDEGITVEESSIMSHPKYSAGDSGEEMSDEEGTGAFTMLKCTRSVVTLD